MEMKMNYLLMSETFVIHEGEKILSFISMVDDYLEALFIDITYQKKSYGKRLLQFIKQEKEIIQLKVNQKKC